MIHWESQLSVVSGPLQILSLDGAVNHSNHPGYNLCFSTLDTLKYIYVPGQGTKVQDCDNPMPVFCYDHKVWEENYAS